MTAGGCLAAGSRTQSKLSGWRRTPMTPTASSPCSATNRRTSWAPVVAPPAARGGAEVGRAVPACHPGTGLPRGAHEPPAPAGADKQRHDDLRETYRREGAFSALQKIVAQASPGFDDREPDVELPTAPDVMR